MKRIALHLATLLCCSHVSAQLNDTEESNNTFYEYRDRLANYAIEQQTSPDWDNFELVSTNAVNRVKRQEGEIVDNYELIGNWRGPQICISDFREVCFLKDGYQIIAYANNPDLFSYSLDAYVPDLLLQLDCPRPYVTAGERNGDVIGLWFECEVKNDSVLSLDLRIQYLNDESLRGKVWILEGMEVKFCGPETTTISNSFRATPWFQALEEKLAGHYREELAENFESYYKTTWNGPRISYSSPSTSVRIQVSEDGDAITPKRCGRNESIWSASFSQRINGLSTVPRSILEKIRALNAEVPDF